MNTLSKQVILDELGDYLLQRFDPKDTDTLASEIRLVIKKARSPQEIDNALTQICRMIEGGSVQAIRGVSYRPYWAHIALLFIDLGPEQATIIYNVERERWSIGAQKNGEV